MWKNLTLNNDSVELLEQKLDNWVKILETLKLTLIAKLKSTSYLQFAEQILKVTINGLIQLLKTVTMDFPKSSDDFQKAEDLFAKYLKDMRSFLQNKNNRDILVDEIYHGSQITQSWSTMSEEVRECFIISLMCLKVRL